MKRTGEEGVALVKILFFTAILLLVAAYAARGTRFEVRIAQNDSLQRQALAIGEAGLDHAWRQIEADLAGGTSLATEVSGSGTTFWSTGTAGSGTYSGYRVGPSLGNGTYYMTLANNSDDPGPGETDGIAVITAIGTVGGAQRQLQAILEQSHAFGQGLFAKYSLTISGTPTTTDSYNSNNGLYGGTNVGSDGNIGSNGDIAGNGQPTVHGSATAGGNVNQGNMNVTGGVSSGAPQIALPDVPNCSTTMGYSSGTGITDFSSSTHSISANSHDTVTLSAGTYCFSSITLSSHAILNVTGPVQIYLTGASDFTGGGISNNASPATPANLQIYSSCDSSCGTGLKMTGGSNAFYSVYAPEATIQFNSNPGNIYGAIIGGNVTLAGGAGFHYDDALKNTGPLVTELASWHEVRN